MNFLTVKEAAERAGVSESTVTWLCRKFNSSRRVRWKNQNFLIDEKLLIAYYPDAVIFEEPLNSQEPEQVIAPSLEDLQNLILVSNAALFGGLEDQQKLMYFLENEFKYETGLSSLLKIEKGHLKQQLEEQLKLLEEKDRQNTDLHSSIAVINRNIKYQTRLLDNQEKREKDRRERADQLPQESEEVEYKPFRWEWLNRRISFYPLLPFAVVVFGMVACGDPLREHFNLVTVESRQSWVMPIPLTYFIPVSLYYTYSYLSKRANFYKITWIWRQ